MPVDGREGTDTPVAFVTGEEGGGDDLDRVFPDRWPDFDWNLHPRQWCVSIQDSRPNELTNATEVCPP